MNDKKKQKKLERIWNGMVRAMVMACEKGEAPAHIQAHYDSMWDDIRAEVLKQMEKLVLFTKN